MKKEYNLFKNASYALNGFSFLLKEKAFQIEIVLIIPLLFILFFIDLTFIQKSIMAGSLIIILIIESLNTAIESVVDLVTNEWHILAKRAKDIASSAVMLSIIQAVIIWGINLIDFFK